jgi:hypothetical protein
MISPLPSIGGVTIRLFLVFLLLFDELGIVDIRIAAAVTWRLEPGPA